MVITTRLRNNVVRNNNKRQRTSRRWSYGGPPYSIADSRKYRCARNRYQRQQARNATRQNRRLRMHVPVRAQTCSYVKIFAVRCAA
jgi:hypothetical protein